MKNWNFINGWSLKTIRANSVLCLMLMNLLTTASISQASDDENPGLALLEFLAEGVMVEDEYLDPMNYADIDSGTVATIQSGQPGSSEDQEVNNDE